MRWNRRTRFAESFWEFGIAQKIFNISYLINSETFSVILTVAQKITIVELLFFCALVYKIIHSQKTLHTFSWFPDREKYFRCMLTVAICGYSTVRGCHQLVINLNVACTQQHVAICCRLFNERVAILTCSRLVKLTMYNRYEKIVRPSD